MGKIEREIAIDRKNNEREENDKASNGLFLSTHDNSIRVSLDKRLYLSLLTVGLLVKDRHVDGEVLPVTTRSSA